MIQVLKRGKSHLQMMKRKQVRNEKVNEKSLLINDFKIARAFLQRFSFKLLVF